MTSAINALFPTTKFKRYIHKNTGNQVFAGQVGEADLEMVRTFWGRDDVDVEDFIILKRGGDINVFTDQVFTNNHRRPDADELVVPQVNHPLYKGEKKP